MTDAPTVTPAAPSQAAEGAPPPKPIAQAEVSPGKTPQRSADGKFTGARAGVPAVEATAPAPRKLRLKRGDEEREFDEAEVIRRAQKHWAGEDYFAKAQAERELAKADRAVVDRIKGAKTTVEARAALRELLGDKTREVAEEEIYEAIQAEGLTPEQRRVKELEGKLADRERQDKAAKEKAEETQREVEAGKYREQFGRSAMAAIEKLGLPHDSAPSLVRRMAPKMRVALEMGEAIDADVIAAEVREEIVGELRALTKDLKGEALVAMLGDNVANAIRRWDLARQRDGTLQPRVVVPPKPQSDDDSGDPRRGRWNFIDKLERGEIP